MSACNDRIFIMTNYFFNDFCINKTSLKLNGIHFERNKCILCVMLFLGQCSQECTSTSCLLVEEEQKVADSQTTDIQSTRHILVCLLLTISLLAVSTVI